MGQPIRSQFQIAGVRAGRFKLVRESHGRRLTRSRLED